MVLGMVGMNYRLKQRTMREGLRMEEVEVGEENIKSSEIRYTEGEVLSSRVVSQESNSLIQKSNTVNL